MPDCRNQNYKRTVPKPLGGVYLFIVLSILSFVLLMGPFAGKALACLGYPPVDSRTECCNKTPWNSLPSDYAATVMCCGGVKYSCTKGY